MLNKKAQEEMMGFVLIVLIVVIIGVVFLAFAMRRPVEGPWQKSAEAADLLNSMLSYTTDCTIGRESLSVRELIRECVVSDGRCNDNRKFCTVINTTVHDMFKNLIGAEITEAPIHGYNFTVVQNGELQSVGNNPKKYISHGNTTGSSFIASVPIPLGPGKGTVEARLRCWYARKA